MCVCIAQVHDWKLFLGVLSLVVVDVIILGVYTIVEYPRGLNGTSVAGLRAQKVINKENSEDLQGVGVVMNEGRSALD